MHLPRDLVRRPARTALTVLGVVIGIWTLVVFVSMANRINAMVGNGSAFFDGGAITVWGGGGTTPKSSPVDIQVGAELARIPGVDVVVPSIQMTLSDEAGGSPVSLPPTIFGVVPGGDHGRDIFPMAASSGRLLAPTDAGSRVAVVGWDLAGRFGWQAGQTVTLRGVEFLIVGILAPTLTEPDNAVMVPLPAAQELFVATLPDLERSTLRPQEVVTGFMVYPAVGADAASIAGDIRAVAPDLGIMTPDDYRAVMGTYAALMTGLLVGVALISIAVGGLSLVNTMAMAAAERTREIGIKRAIGATRLRIVREVVTESAAMGFLGGLAGLALAALAVTIANDAGRPSGTILFQLTVETAVGAVFFATLLGAFAGLLPALRAARMDPVEALRHA